MKAAKLCLTLALTLAIAGGAIADEKKAAKGEKKADAAKKGDAKKGDRKKKGRGQRAFSVVRFPASLELTKEQSEKLAAINKEYAPKAQELRKVLESVLTEDQKKARVDAQKAIRALDKNDAAGRKKLFAAARPKLSDEQKKKSSEAQKAFVALRKEAMAKATALLTDDQKAKLPKRPTRKPGAKKGDAKKGAKKGDKKPDAAK